MKRLTFFAVTLTASLVFASGIIGGSASVSAVTASDWVPGRIISDGVFFNAYSMDTSNIQAFLNAKVPTCDSNGDLPYPGYANRRAYSAANGVSTPFTCLKDYSQNTPTMNANAYCSNTYTGGTKTAAQIIKDVSVACSINPQVLLVLLQKEQGLITDDWPWPIQYTKATGFSCPDTAPCDPAYAGFFYQIYYAARQFQRYAKEPNSFNYRAKQNNFISYQANNPGCGGTIVYIENQATAGLYNYTPYQPNQAALNNLYGTGDGCSAYGNRNFWRMFSDWFGSTIGNLYSGNGGIYLIENGTKRAFPNELVFLSYSYKWKDVVAVSNAELNLIPDGAAVPYNVNFRNGLLVTSPSGGAYVVDNGFKRPFPNEGTFFSYGYKYTDALVITAAEISLIPDGTAMQYNAHLRDGLLVTTPSGGVYVVDNGLKRPFANEAAFFSYTYTYADALVISEAELSLIPFGTAMPYRTNFRNGRLITFSGGGIYRVDSGTKRAFPNELVFLSYSYKWTDVIPVSSTELSLIPDGTVVSYNVNFRNGFLVTSPSGGMYVVDSGFKRPFPNEGTFFSYGYKYTDALVITAAELNLIPVGAAMPPKS